MWFFFCDVFKMHVSQEYLRKATNSSQSVSQFFNQSSVIIQCYFLIFLLISCYLSKYRKRVVLLKYRIQGLKHFVQMPFVRHDFFPSIGYI